MSSIVDVAREAKVALSTVSLVYSSPSRVSESTRRKVEEASLRLGYRPRNARQSPRVHLAVVYSKAMAGHSGHGSMFEYCRQWIAGVRNLLDAQGTDISVCPVEDNIADDPMFQRSLDERDFTGLLTLGIHEEHGHVEAAVARGVPTVCVNRLSPTGDFSTVTVDYRGMGVLASRRLLSAGHRVIAHGFAQNARPLVENLRKGIIDEVLAAGLPRPLELPGVEGYDDLEGFRRMARFVRDAGVTACIMGDPSASRMSEALAAEGMDVPKDVSLVGIDALNYRTPLGKRITSIGYNAKVMGETCTQILQQLIASHGEIRQMTATINVRLVEGETVEAPPKQPN